MSALNQYLDLYREHQKLIDANGAGPLNDLRGDAYAQLSEMKLPKADSDNYENCDLEAILAPDYGINLAKLNIDVNPQATFRCDVPMLTESPFMLINDTFAASKSMIEGLPEGVEAGSLRVFGLDYPEDIKRYYGKLADIKNPIVALNTLFAQDGFYLRVKKGVRLEKPLQLVNILENGMPLMAVRRLLIIVEEDAEATLLVCEHSQNPDVQFLDLEAVEIFAARNARFDYYNLEESTEKTSRLSALYLSQEEGSHVSIDGLTLFNGATRNEYYTRFNGEHAELHLYGMGIEDDSRKVSTYSHINHAVPDCISNELFKFSLDDEAKGAFSGRIYVAPGAVKTEAYQSNRNLVGSDDARMFSRPELEIYNDDVKCSHGCAIGKPDELQLFYMRTRGLSESTAKLLLKQAFMADIIDRIRIPSLRDRLHLMVERRFAGERSACAGCPVCKSHEA